MSMSVSFRPSHSNGLTEEYRKKYSLDKFEKIENTKIEF